MGKEAREQSERECLHMHTWAMCPAQEGGHVCPFLQSPGLGVNRQVILTGAEHGYQVWEQFAKEGHWMDLVGLSQAGGTAEGSISF